MTRTFKGSSLWLFFALIATEFAYGTISLPPAFSFQHRAAHMKEDTPVENILNVLSTYELDSHIEVVLVGKVFDQKVVNELSASLESLTSLSLYASPLKHVHEKQIYHVSIAKGLEDEVLKQLDREKGLIAATATSELFKRYHLRAATPTTLFVVHLGADIAYSYTSRIEGCPQRAFISNDGFAWVDISANAVAVRNSAAETDQHVLSETSFKGFKRDNSNDIHELATLIHRSGESLVPFPIFANDVALLSDSHTRVNAMSLLNQHSDFRSADIVLITICVDGDKCKDDVESARVVQKAVRMFSQPTFRVGQLTYAMSASNDPVLTHAIHSAIQHSVRTGDVFKISSSELLYWLGSAVQIRGLFSALGVDEVAATRRIVPIFVLGLPKDLDAYLDDYKQAVALHFPEPPGGWLALSGDAINDLNSKKQKMDEQSDMEHDLDDILWRLHWPSSAVVAVQPAPGAQLSHIRTGLECGGNPIPASEDDYEDELLNMIQAAIWGILPGRIHYSTSSRSLVLDYMWDAPPSLRVALGASSNPRDDGKSFREHRVISRHTIVHAADHLLHKAANIIRDAAAVQPPINMTEFLNFKPSHNKPAQDNADSLSKSPFGAVESNKAAAAKKKTTTSNSGSSDIVNDGEFAHFLTFLNAASHTYSHLDFSSAAVHMNNAELAIRAMTQRLEELIASRTGELLCRDVTDVEVKGDRGLHNGEHHNQFHIGPSSSTSSMFSVVWWVLLVGGIVLGVVYGTSSRQKRPRNN